MKKIKDIEQFFLSELGSYYIKEEVKSFVLLLLNHLRDYDRKDIIIKENELLKDEEILYLKDALLRLKKNEPIQYIIGYTEFFGSKFYTDKRALIPRPETELLINLIIKENKNIKSILDIGTGSGCIAVSLKKHFSNSKVYAWDISPDALGLAEKNANYHKVEIDFKEIDILSAGHINNKYDLIVSNPPYVTPADKEFMKENVLNFEPHFALFVEMDNPLIFYKKIAKFGQTHLEKNGSLYFEINENYGNEIMNLLEKADYSNVEVIQDLSGRNRMVRATWMY